MFEGINIFIIFAVLPSFFTKYANDVSKQN